MAVAIAGSGALALGAIAAAGMLALKPNVMEQYTLDAGEKRGDGEPVEEIIIEYARKVPFKGYAASHLFPSEPLFKRGEGSGLAISSKEDLLLPVGWRWDGDWCLLQGTLVTIYCKSILKSWCVCAREFIPGQPPPGGLRKKQLLDLR